MWDRATQCIVDNFRSELEGCQLQVCPTCKRFQPNFLGRGTTGPGPAKCSHCTKRQSDSGKSRFGVDDNMDPGEVLDSLLFKV